MDAKTPAYDVEAIRADFPILSREVYGKPLGDLDRSGLPARLDQFRDQFDVILRHLAFMCLTHGRKAIGLRLGSPVDRFEWLTPL